MKINSILTIFKQTTIVKIISKKFKKIFQKNKKINKKLKNIILKSVASKKQMNSKHLKKKENSVTYTTNFKILQER